jgi:hypothetical protein
MLPGAALCPPKKFLCRGKNLRVTAPAVAWCGPIATENPLRAPLQTRVSRRASPSLVPDMVYYETTRNCLLRDDAEFRQARLRTDRRMGAAAVASWVKSSVGPLPRTAKPDQVFSAVYPEGDFGVRCLGVCSPNPGNTGCLLTRRPVSDVPSLVFPLRQNLPIER